MVKAPTTWAEGVGGGAAAMTSSSRRRSSQTGTSSRQHRTNASGTGGTSRKRPTSSTYPDTTSSSSSGDNPLMLSGSAMGVDLSRGVTREEILRRRNKLAALNESMSSSDRAVMTPSYTAAAAADEEAGGLKRDMGQHGLLKDYDGGGGKMKRVGSEDALGASVDSNSAGSLPLAMRELSIEIGGPSSPHANAREGGGASKYVEYEGQLNDVTAGRDRREEGMKIPSSREPSSRTIHSKSTAHSRSTTESATTAAMKNLEPGGASRGKSPRRRRSSQASGSGMGMPYPRNEEVLQHLEHMVTTKDVDAAGAGADKYSDEMEGWMMTAGMATATSRAASEDNELDEEYRAAFADAQQRRLEEHRQRKGSGDRDRDRDRDRDKMDRDRDRHSRREATRRSSNERDGYHDRTPERKQHRRSSSDQQRQKSRRSSVDHADQQDAKTRRMMELEMQLQAMEEEKLRLEQEQLAERMRKIEKEKRRLEKEEAMKMEQQREMEAAAGSGRNAVRRRKSGSAIEAGSRLLEELNGLDLAPEQEGVEMHNSAPDLKIERDSLQEAAQQRSKQRRRSSMVTTSRRGSGEERSRKISDLDTTGVPSPSRERERDRGRNRDRASRRRSSRGYTAQVDTQEMFDAGRSSRRSSMKGSRSRDEMEKRNEMPEEKRGKRPSNSDMPQEMSLSHSELDQELLRGLPGMLKRENSDERNKRKSLSRENSGDRTERRSSNQDGKRSSSARDDGRAQRRPSVQFAADQEIIARRRSAENGAAEKPRRAERRGSIQSTGVLSIESKQSQHASLASAVGEAVRKAERRNSNERERIKAEEGDAPTSSQPKPKASRRSSMDNSATSNSKVSSVSQSTTIRRNSDPSEPKKDFTASRRSSISATSTADPHSTVSRRGSTSNMLKDSGVMLLSADIDLGDEPKAKLRLKKLAKKLTLKKGGDPERVPSIFDR